ncbi:MAG: Glutamine-scyllo-inositol transaminase [Parcubacteria group bacterium GW2011_GWC2_42_12]|uniref:Transcriptional regulator n=1 Tax=Candidatus Falkowbacteria bacterium RIFCSPHIGHO2_02_FULL_42_9 TaxID=1797986 RepID=A0A1F5SAI5_9BACT|nr:MAG: Glutamine-scyllo-inositol transaminase [Parcubacteria group bacterium GW2011_GWC2_42_12]OGF23473.1 MAG: hypothetical protein A3D45_01105 [Candidatus Falkowbacteria bacterium RIFCSPHIGHO2_02_FULL_42_9]
MKVEFFRHNISETDIKNLNKVLRTLLITTAGVTGKFEKDFAAYLQCPHVIGVNSCTNALFLSLLALNIGPGDEVITTPLTFFATANAILYVGAKPVFVDVEAETGLIDPVLIEKAITKRTKAILPVHLYGQMCDMKRINSIAKRHGLKIIEDAALCMEGVRDEIRPGQLSQGVCFSFHAIKSITSGEGGAIAVNDSGLDKKLRLLRLHGIGGTVLTRVKDKIKKQDMILLGYKCNMYDLQAALLINQIERIEVNLQRRTFIYDRYQAAFAGNPKIIFPTIVAGSQSAKTMFPLWVDVKKRDKYLVDLQNQGLGVDIKYHPVHLSTYYRRKFGYKKGDFPLAEKISRSTITLPLYPKLKDKELDYVIKIVNRVIV